MRRTVEAGDGRSGTAPLGEALCWGLGSWAALRALSTLAGLASGRWLSAGPTVAVPGYAPPELSGGAAVLAGAWLRADALWYLKVAADGYGPQAGSYAFFPLFPLLIRAAVPLAGGNELYAALLVANLACAGGLVLLYLLLAHLGGPRAARAAIAGLALFPTAFFLVAPYAEPVLLLAGSGALLAAARGRGAPAALLAAAAALSRPFGVLLALPLAPLGRGPARWAGPAGAAAGFLGWLAYAGMRTGDAGAALSVQAAWQRSPRFPAASLVEGARAWWRWRGSDAGPYFLLDLVSAAFLILLAAAAAGVLARAGARGAAWVIPAHALLVLMAPLAAPFPPRPLMSVPRFVLAAFPAFVGLGVVPGRIGPAVAALSAAGLVWATMLYVAARPLF